MIVLERPEWQQQAACAGADRTSLFLPAQGKDAIAARRFCVACPVRIECLDYALDNGESVGIWGGLSDRERRRIKRSSVR